MLYRKIIAVCSEIHTKHINTVCGQNVEFLEVSSNFPKAAVSLSCLSVCLSILLHKKLNPQSSDFVAFYNTWFNKICQQFFNFVKTWHIRSRFIIVCSLRTAVSTLHTCMQYAHSSQYVSYLYAVCAQQSVRFIPVCSLRTTGTWPVVCAL